MTPDMVHLANVEPHSEDRETMGTVIGTIFGGILGGVLAFLLLLV